jgi:hypothetical protein
VVGPSVYDGAWQAVDYLTSPLDLMKINPDAFRHVPIPLDDLVERSVLFLRDLFDNPFRPVTLSPGWRSPVVQGLAQAAYDEREQRAGPLDNARLAVLADALGEADCTDALLLGHLRGPGPHVRGCWAVDLLLGKG